MSLTTLFLDLNAYFASVEQQVRPELRGKPVGVIPVDTDRTCCIASSYEAQRFGIKTGTNVREAKQLCPELRVVVARPELYVEFHHRIVRAVETCLPVHAVYSIDELACRLSPSEQQLDAALALARRVKQAVSTQVGHCMRSSIGLAPNRFIAKVASDMQKPDGLVVLQKHELPQRLYALELTDLPGLGPRMAARLRGQGIYSVRDLCARSESDLIRLWNGVTGGRMWHILRGEEWFEPPVRKRSIGHQHVLPPALRNPQSARAVFIRLIHKTMARVRYLGYWARNMTVFAQHTNGTGWQAAATLELCQDTREAVRIFAELWRRHEGGTPLSAGVTFYNLVPAASVTDPLFPAAQKSLRVSRVMDLLNARHGANTVYSGGMHGVLDSAPVRIAFSSIPDYKLKV